MRIFSIIAGVCACFLSVSNARADGSLKDGPMPAPAGRCIGGAFAGPYAGVQLGFGSARSHQDVEQYDDDNLIGTVGFSDNDKGFTVGGYGGYNVQCGRVVFGLETDFNYFGTNTRSDVDICGSSPCGAPVGSGSFRSSMDWFGTLRGRLGLVDRQDYMIYVTAGLAYANVDHRFTTDVGPGNTVLSPAFSQSNSGTQVGWTVGGGVEFLRDQNWSIRAEALYVDLGSEDVTYKLDTGCGSECRQGIRWDDNFWVVRLGLAYRFNRPEPVAEYTPLK